MHTWNILALVNFKTIVLQKIIQSDFILCISATAAQHQNVQQQEEANLANVALAISLPQIYGDERDSIIARWNQLQAFWGTGKGFYSSNGVVDFKPENPFCRFKVLKLLTSLRCSLIMQLLKF